MSGGYLARSRPAGRVLGLLFLIASALLGWFWWTVQGAMLEQVPARHALAKVVIGAAPDSSLVIGRRELGQRASARSAEVRHLGLRRDHSGQWTLSNVAAARRVLLHYEAFGNLYLRRWAIRDGDRLLVGGRLFEVTRVDPDGRLELLAGQRRYRILFGQARGIEVEASVGQSDRPPPGWLERHQCSPPHRWREALHRAFSGLERRFRPADEQRLASFGGGVDCPDRIAAPEAAPDSLRIVYRNGVLFFAPGRGGAAPAFFRRAADSGWSGFADIRRPLFPSAAQTLEQRPLGRLDWIIVGKTRYRVARDGVDRLLLMPDRNIHQFFDLGTNRSDDQALRPLDVQQLREDLSRRPDGVEYQAITRHAASISAGFAAWPDPDPDAARLERHPLLLLVVAAAGATLLTALFLRLFYPSRRGRRRRRDGHRRSLRLVGIAGNRSVTALLLWSAALFWILLLLGAYRLELPRPVLGALLLGSWVIASLSIWRAPERNGRLMLFWLLMSGVILIGSLNLELLAQGAHDSYWLQFDRKHCASLGLTFLVVTLVSSIAMQTWSDLFWTLCHPKTSLQRLLRWVFVLALVLVFTGWLLFGREEGLSFFQPVEMGKFVAVLVLAVATASIDLARRFADFDREILRIAGWVLMFFALLGTLLVGIPALKSDYSPILILVVLGITMLAVVSVWLWAHRRNRRRLIRERWSTPPGRAPLRPRWLAPLRWRRPGWLPRLEMLAVLFSLSLAGALLWFVDAAMDRVSDQRGTAASLGFNTPEQRVAVYHAPEDYPDLGGQLLQSFGAVADTPCYAWERQWFMPLEPGWAAYAGCVGDPAFDLHASRRTSGLAGSAQPADSGRVVQGTVLNPPALMSLPAVQDDFALAFLINRFGVTTALVLGLLQIGILWLMIDTALSKYVWGLGDYADDAVRQVICFLTLGGAGLLLLHWVISWGNVFGLLPVMGQPMTWVSSANSHLWFMATPILATTLIAMRLSSGQGLTLLSADAGPPDQPFPVAERVKVVWRRWRAARAEDTETRASDARPDDAEAFDA